MIRRMNMQDVIPLTHKRGAGMTVTRVPGPADLRWLNTITWYGKLASIGYVYLRGAVMKNWDWCEMSVHATSGSRRVEVWTSLRRSSRKTCPKEYFWFAITNVGVYKNPPQCVFTARGSHHHTWLNPVTFRQTHSSHDPPSSPFVPEALPWHDLSVAY